MNHSLPIPEDLKEIQQLLQSSNFSIQNIVIEKECLEYKGYQFEYNNKKFLFRKSKTTPTKKGQFVTVWKRTPAGPIAPFDQNDAIDFVIILSESPNFSGFFIFSAKVLLAQAIFSTKEKEGKRAFRVYLPNEKLESKQALKTQQWQADFFIEKIAIDCFDLEQVQKLLE